MFVYIPYLGYIRVVWAKLSACSFKNGRILWGRQEFYVIFLR